MSEKPPDLQAAPPVVAIAENRARVTAPTGSGPAVIASVIARCTAAIDLPITEGGNHFDNNQFIGFGI